MLVKVFLKLFFVGAEKIDGESASDLQACNDANY